MEILQHVAIFSDMCLNMFFLSVDGFHQNLLTQEMSIFVNTLKKELKINRQRYTIHFDTLVKILFIIKCSYMRVCVCFIPIYVLKLLKYLNLKRFALSSKKIKIYIK